MKKSVFAVAAIAAAASVSIAVSQREEEQLTAIQLENIEALGDFAEWWDSPAWSCHDAYCSLWLCWDCRNRRAEIGKDTAHPWDCGCNGIR